jgi:hypothetical protein
MVKRSRVSMKGSTIKLQAGLDRETDMGSSLTRQFDAKDAIDASRIYGILAVISLNHVSIRVICITQLHEFMRRWCTATIPFPLGLCVISRRGNIERLVGYERLIELSERKLSTIHLQPGRARSDEGS